MKILLVRHGQTDYNKQERVQGHSDIPLNELGITQAVKASKKLDDFVIDKAYSSTLSRAYDTARYMLDNSKNNKIEVEKDIRLIEKFYGKYEGVTFEEYGAGLLKGDLGGMETDEVAADRIENFFLEKYKNHKEETILVVCHGGVIRSFLTEKNIKDVGRGIVKNTSLSIIEYNGEKFILKEFNK